MKKILLIILLISAVAALPGICQGLNMATLKTGDKAPEFRLKNQNGEWVSLKDFHGEKNLVVYFYPKDETPVCTAEACEFRDQYETFKDLGAEVIGISNDSVESHKKFENKRKLPFILLSDPDGKIKKSYGVGDGFLGMLPGRVTFVVDKKGIIRHSFESALRAKKHVEESLKIIQNLE